MIIHTLKVQDILKRPVFSSEKMAEVQGIISQFPEGKQKSAIIRSFAHC
jgi:hypothetical protein